MNNCHDILNLHKRFIIQLSFCLFICNTIQSQSCTEEFILSSIQGSTQDSYGFDVSISGDLILIGEPKDDTKGRWSGCAYLYEWDGSSWNESDFYPPTGYKNAQFGQAVSISENRFVVGAPTTNNGPLVNGSCFIYDWNGTTWDSIELHPNTIYNNNSFGKSVLLQEDSLFVGAPGDISGTTITGAVYSYIFDGTQWVETRITASDGAQGDEFGMAVDFSHGRLVVGTPSEDTNGFSAGAVYIYEWDGSTWNETKLIATDGAASDKYGSSVSTYENKVLVGAYQDDDNGTSAGSAYLYEWDGSTWNETKFLGSNTSNYDNFGTSVKVTPDKLIVGAPFGEYGGISSGLIYEYSYNGSSWTESMFTNNSQQTNEGFGFALDWDDRLLTSSPLAIVNELQDGRAFLYEDQGGNIIELEINSTINHANELLGLSVDIYENNIVAGSSGFNANGIASGAIIIYDWNCGTPSADTIIPLDGDEYDRFGNDVAVFENKIVTGAHLNDDNGLNSGSVYYYERQNNNWIETKINSNFVNSNDYFGYAVDIYNSEIIAGARGYDGMASNSGGVFHLKQINGQWIETPIVASDGSSNDDFGQSVAFYNGRIVVGAPSDHDNGPLSGSIYIYTRDGTNWNETKIISSDGSAYDKFGASVDIYQDRILVGAHYDDDNGFSSGSGYVYDWDGTNWIETKLVASDASTNDQFGSSVSIKADKILIGAPYKNARKGKTYLFNWNGSHWNESQITASNGCIYDQFGQSNAIYQDRLLIGAYSDKGRVYGFECCQGTTGPVAICNNVSINLDETGTFIIGTESLDGGSSDDCGYPDITASQTVFSCPDIGDTNIILTATDCDGSTDSCVSVVTITDIYGHCCPDNLEITVNPIPDGTYKANINITTNKLIKSGSTIILKSGDVICIDPGFEIELGATLETLQGPCPN